MPVTRRMSRRPMLTRFGARSLRKLKRAVRLSKAGLKKRTPLVRAGGISSWVFPTISEWNGTFILPRQSRVSGSIAEGNQWAGVGAEVFVERKFAGQDTCREIKERAGDCARSAGNV